MLKIKSPQAIKDKIKAIDDINIKDSFKNKKENGIESVKEQLKPHVEKVIIDMSSRGRNFLSDEKKVKKSADIAYKALPIPIKVIVRKKRFRNLVFKLREKCLEDKASDISECSDVVFEENSDVLLEK